MNIDRTLFSIVAGLGGMFGWGTSDFLANSASEKVGYSRAFFWSQIAGLVLIIVLLIVMMPSFAIAPQLLGLAVFGGVAYALGYLFFYRGFEIGNVSVISAVINLQVIFIIVLSFFVHKQTLTLLQLPAIALLITGVTLVSVNHNDLRKGTVTLLKGVKEALIGSVMFGVFYWPLNEYVVENADWLAIGFITKLTAIAAVFLIFSFRKQSMKIQKPTKKLVMLIAAVGLLEAVGVLSVTVGQSFGDGIIVAPISSALTVVTVALAMIFTKERINKIQAAGIAMAVVGIILTGF